MSSEVRAIVETTYRDHIGMPADWTPSQQQLFLEQESARLSHRIEDLAAEMGASARSDWARQTGQEPDYPTTVGLLNNAALQARETVLSEELYDKVPSPEETPTEDLDGLVTELDLSVDWGNPDRWRTARRSDPSPAVEALVAQLWPTRSDWFTIKAEYLLQARIEDKLEVPASGDSELAQTLARLVEDDLRSDGLPVE